MKVAAALVLLALVASGALAMERLGQGPDLRAVAARADSIRRADGALLATFERDGRAWLQWVRPLTLRPASRPLRLRDDFVSDFARSPDGGTLVLGSGTHSRIEFIDLRGWRSLGTMRVPGARPAGYRGVSGLVWPRARRLLALAGPPYMRAWPVVVDPVRRRVVHRTSLRGAPLRWQAAGDRLVFLSSPEGHSSPPHARLVSYDVDGRLRRLRFDRIVAGSWRVGHGPWRREEPGLTATATDAYVVAADGRLAAEVDLRAWRLDYHEISEARSAWRRLAELVTPPAYAKGPLQSRVRSAQALPGGAIAVTGEDMDVTGDGDEPRTTAYGVRLIDPVSWTLRTVDHDAQDVLVAGGLLLARRWACRCINALPSIGLRGYDTAGELRFTRFEDSGVTILGAAGDHAYVAVKRKGTHRIHVVELETGETQRVLPYRELRLLGGRQ